MSIIEVPTRWGSTPAQYRYLRHPAGSSKLAVLFPGQVYPLDAPLMWYSAKAAFQAGCDVLGVEYGYQANKTELDSHDRRHLVEETTEALEGVVTSEYSSVVFIGKSIGTVIQTETVQNVSLSVRNHVYMTPLRPIIPTILESENAMVIVGDQDSLFDRSDIAQISNVEKVSLHVVPGADHMLETEGVADSIAILKDAVNWCQDFCRRLL